MSRLFYHVMQDSAGNLLLDVTGTMRLAGTGTLATIYGDAALTIPLPNPMTNHASYGSFKCYLAGGSYDFSMAKSGYSFETLTGLQGQGTMAQQNANAVAITGGDLQNISPLGIQTSLSATAVINLRQYKTLGQYGMVFTPDNDAAIPALIFLNAALANVGSIGYTGTTTSYNTTSDARLKHDIAPLNGALDVVRALKPISHRWRSDESPGVGFLAHEVQAVVDGVITGNKDAVDDEGHIVPQMMDYSKLVPWLVSAVKELTQQVEMLQAQLAASSV